MVRLRHETAFLALLLLTHGCKSAGNSDATTPRRAVLSVDCEFAAALINYTEDREVRGPSAADLDGGCNGLCVLADHQLMLRAQGLPVMALHAGAGADIEIPDNLFCRSGYLVVSERVLENQPGDGFFLLTTLEPRNGTVVATASLSQKGSIGVSDIGFSGTVVNVARENDQWVGREVLKLFNLERARAARGQRDSGK